ncbi:MAG: carbohydrate ABC transporter permease [Clostridia bacterium]|nr:carbohydrate ABC transporter permease [Clostridia bacterium]
MVGKRKKTDLMIDGLIYLLLGLLSLITLLPFLQVITISFSPSSEVLKYGFKLFPTKIDLSGYIRVFQNGLIWNSYLNTIIRTLAGTSLSVLLTVLGAYPLSKKYLPNRKLRTGLIVFTMYFSGGLIPLYILVNNLGLRDTLGALILPGAICAFTLIVARNFFMTIPESLEESARIDGANDIYILFKIIIPLSLPILATISLWYGVNHWNSWFDNMLYMKTQEKFVLQYVLRMILMEGTAFTSGVEVTSFVNSDTMKMATLVVSTVPIIMVYPFLQKYFVKGLLIGSVKG